MGKNDTVSFAIAGFSQAAANKIAAQIPGENSTVEKLSAAGAGLLRDLAAGGVMVEQKWADRIEKAIGSVEPEAIVEAVERSMNRVGEAVSVTWVVDPTQIQYFRELAESNNLTLEQHLKSVLDNAVLQGWLLTGAPDPFKLLLSREQHKYLQARFCKDVVTGEDVVEALRGNDISSDTDLALDLMGMGN